MSAVAGVGKKEGEHKPALCATFSCAKWGFFPGISEVGGYPWGSPDLLKWALLEANPGFSGVFGIRV
jgi:hypothetical protein